MRRSWACDRMTAFRFSPRRSRVEGVELRVTEIIAPGQVFMPFHYVETNSNLVTQSAFDPSRANRILSNAL
jgi:hypothetical protein